MAYDELEPIGSLRGDYQAASICSTIANVGMAQARSTKRFRTQDFLLEFGGERTIVEEPEPRQSWQEQKMIAMMYAAAFTEPEKK